MNHYHYPDDSHLDEPAFDRLAAPNWAFWAWLVLFVGLAIGIAAYIARTAPAMID